MNTTDLIACMGGWCTRRGTCGHFHAAESRNPVERMCVTVQLESWIPIARADSQTVQLSCQQGGVSMATANPFRSIWLSRLWRESLESKRGFTPTEAIEQFGSTQSSSLPEDLLEAGAREGWFRRDRWTDAADGVTYRRCRYFAIEPAPSSYQGEDRRTSYFGHMPMVRTVFELGALK